jgi:hypothetical protein
MSGEASPRRRPIADGQSSGEAIVEAGDVLAPIPAIDGTGSVERDERRSRAGRRSPLRREVRRGKLDRARPSG